MHADRNRPEDWAALARRVWRRKKWRRTDGTAETETCTACGIPLHRKSTYYLRPAYTDGRVWLCWRCRRRMQQAVRRDDGNQYRHRRET